MKYRFSKMRNSSFIVIFGFEIAIEYRTRLKTFDLIYYPNKGKTYGQTQFYDKYICRHNDFTSLMACIIKASEDFSEGTLDFFVLLKLRCSELILTEAMATAESPAHSSTNTDVT